jgi:hypothetical protein
MEDIMKNSKMVSAWFLLASLAICLSGCQKITSASPDPDKLIEMRPGDKVVFEVEGPVNTLTKRCYWDLYKQGVGYVSAPVGTNRFEFQANPEGEPTNRITITCWAESLGIWVGEQGSIFIVWTQWDNREWKIRVLQDTKPVWHGTYVIEDETDLHLLEGYSSITGDLYIFIDETASLEGLESLTTIGGNLYIDDIRSLTDLSGLRNLTSVGGGLIIGDNDDLTNLSGLENLSSVGGKLRIINNPALTSLSALENLTFVGGDFLVADNPTVSSLSGLENLAWAGGLHISENDNLTTLSALGKLTSVNGYLCIQYNDSLTSLGMASLQAVDEDFRIYGNSLLCTSLVEELKDQVVAGGGIGGRITISGNKDCTTP